MSSDPRAIVLSRSVAAGSQTYAVHYACEGFYDEADRPAGISAIAVSSIPGGEDFVFSLTDVAEQTCAEVDLLYLFYLWLRSKPDAQIVHLDMDKSEYGFQAMENRYRYLKADVTVPHHAA